MSNIQYVEIIKSKLSDAGYSHALLNALTKQILTIADERGVNALSLLEELIRDNVDLKKSKSFNNSIPQSNNGMSFTTYRHSNPKPNRFVDRQIINR